MKTTNKFLLALLMLLGFTAAASAQEQNSDTEKPTVYVVSNAHFDSQWNWDIQTSIREYVWNTIYQNLFLLKTFPDYVFNFEGGVKYQWMKEYYPAEYEELKKYVDEGRWKLTGSTWDANDVNVPSPESFVRNVLYGQMFYEEEFGKRGTDFFLPDCFGFSYTMPTIANHCDIIGFSTQKLQWRNKPFYGNSKIPFEWGLWEGVDGARIMLVADAHNYTSRWTNQDLSHNENLIRLANRHPKKTIYHYYGTGDIGGSPTLESVMAVQRGVQGDGPIQIISATSDQLYKDYLPYENHPDLPVYKGELLMDVHGTGCYTSQGAMKLYNRKNELLADAAERAAVMADWLGVQNYPKETLNESWKRFIWHQFHDDLTGTSIPRAYEFSWNDELISQKQFAQILTSSVGSVTRAMNTNVKGIPLVINNTVAYPVKDIIEVTVDLPKGAKSLAAYNEKGQAVPTQMLGIENGKASLLIAAELPPVSFVVYDLRPAKANNKSSLKANSNTIENSIYKVTLNANGDIASIVDKRADKELVKDGKHIRLALFTENESFNWPAWEILKREIDKDPIDITEEVKISVAEQGPVRVSLCVERSYKGESTFRQYITLTDGGQDDRIDIRNEFDWQTTNALVKAEFPLNINNEIATYDLGVGQVQRGNNTETAYEVPAQYWADLTDADGSYGVSILNDSRYGWDKPNSNTLRLTLLHTPKTRGGYAYQNKQDFGFHTMTYSIVGHPGALASNEIVEKAEVLNQPMRAFAADRHVGELGKSLSLVTPNSDQVVIKAIKKAEKLDGYVVRLYETMGKDAKNIQLTFAGEIAEAKELNGVEDVIGNLAFSGNTLTFDAGAFGMKTLLVKLQPKTTKAAKTQSLPLDLKYNVKTATFNEFKGDANFDGKGNSFAAELLPETIVTDDVTFRMGNPMVQNAIKCAGDTVILPQDGSYTRLYILATSTNGDQKASFFIDGKEHSFVIPYYSGFIGQWEHTGHTVGFYKPQELAFIGTHKHSMLGSKDLPYEFTYLFKFGIDLPKNAQRLVLPDNSRVAVFAASLAKNTNDLVSPATELVTTSLSANNLETETFSRRNLVKGKEAIGWSAYVNNREMPKFAVDDDFQTKWCDLSDAKPKFIEFDLGQKEKITGWFVAHAGMESLGYITKEYQLEVKNNPDEAWTLVDKVTNNSDNETDRLLPEPIEARYVRLTILKPDQHEGQVTRIYEFEVY